MTDGHHWTTLAYDVSRQRNCLFARRDLCALEAKVEADRDTRDLIQRFLEREKFSDPKSAAEWAVHHMNGHGAGVIESVRWGMWNAENERKTG